MTNIIDLPCITKLPLDPDRVLSKAVGELTSVVVIGYDKEGCFYFASSDPSGPECLWLIEQAKKQLLDIST